MAVVTGLLDNHDAGSAFRLACLLAIVAIAIALLHRGRVAVTERLLGHVLLLVAAWHARPLLDLAAAVGAPRWLLMTPQVVVVEAFLPVALWRLAQACPVPIRCSGFERASSTAGAVAIACSTGVAVTCGLAALGVSTRAAVAGPWLVLAMALTWSIVTAVTIAARSVPSHRRRLHLVPGARHEPWRPAVTARLASIVGLLRGTPTASLAALGADLQHARSAGEVVAALTTHVRASLDTSVVIVLLPGDPSWTAVEGAVPRLPADSATAALIASADEATRVDSGAGVHHLLPVADQEWLAAVGVATIVRLASKDGDTLAGLLVGPRRYGSAHTRRDRAYLSAAARSAAMALAPMSAAGRVTNSPAIDEDLSHECESCGQVGIGAQRCRCGGRATLAALPASLNAAFRVDRRIGRGGMGVVYLARDLRLHRMVALKTLPAMSPSWVASLLGEARAMAAVAHPSVAVLYGLEQWRGTPVLVTEYLSGGTLASRLAVARVPVPEALHLGASIADALAALHARGWLHRDIKPSNIGFAHDGAPKLLDFGLTQWLPTLDDTAAPPAGTPLYLSPEVARGRTRLAPRRRLGAGADGRGDDQWHASVPRCRRVRLEGGHAGRRGAPS